MPITNAIVKAVRGCNIGCTYCYVDQYGFGSERIQLMSVETLERLFSRVAAHVRSQSLPGFTFYWHGGEPLLQPPSFYAHVAVLTQRYLPDVRVHHLLQTNATRVTRDYARLLKELGFIVSVSLDGPPEINDKLRVDHAGRGTATRVLNGLEILHAEGHPVQILCVVTPDAIGRGAELYRYFRSLGAWWMDFLLPHANARHNTIIPHHMPSQEDFAAFLIDVYDAWMSEGDSGIIVRRLRDYVQLILGGHAATCIFGGDCSYMITVLPDGLLYACDDLLQTFSSPIGTLDEDLDQVASSPILRKVSKGSDIMFGEECLTCEFFDVCRSGCTSFRATDAGTFTDRYYYCDMSKRVIAYIRSDVLARLERAGITPGHARPVAAPGAPCSGCVAARA
jgi:uncharacterized protein